MRGMHRGGRHGRLLRGGHERGFEHGRLRFVLLKLIADQPRHGYELIRAIEERTGGAYAPSPGVIYPTLTLLAEQGHITLEEGEGQRRMCHITTAGRKLLADNRLEIERLESRLTQPRQGRYGDLAPPIIRAMENLKTALRLRLLAGELNAVQIAAIAAALDGAALTIERS